MAKFLSIYVAAMITCIMTTTDASASPVIPPGYEQAVAQVPSQHWTLVTRITLVDRHDYGAAYPDGHLEIPRRPDSHVLIHEVGHLVAYARPDLEDAYWATTTHGKLDRHESFAEAYRAVLEGQPHRATAFMRDRVLTANGVLEQGPLHIVPAATERPMSIAGPCDRPGIAPGSIVIGCSSVPRGSVIPK